jgi:small subunit ribosomal protein S12
MSTYQQSVRNRKEKDNVLKSKALKHCPQRKGVCIKVTTMKPKKPNSAIRKIAKIELTTKKRVLGYICGVGHRLQEHASVLVRGGRVRDLPGIHYKLIRGKYDFNWREAFWRRQARSRYGVPSFKKKIQR